MNNTQASTLSPTLQESTEPKLSIAGTLLGVILRPRATFERMREAQNGHWWLVLLLAFLALVLLTIAMVPIQAEASRAALEAQQEQLSELPPEQQAQTEQMQAIFTSQATLGVIGVATGTIGIAINYAVRAGLLFLLGLALGGRASFKQVWRMAIWTALPDVLRSVVRAITVFVTGGMPIAGLSFVFTSAERATMSPILIDVLGTVDIYLVWGLALIGVGMVATAKFSKAKGAAVAFIYWLLIAAWTAGMAALGQAIAGTFGMG